MCAGNSYHVMGLVRSARPDKFLAPRRSAYELNDVHAVRNT